FGVRIESGWVDFINCFHSEESFHCPSRIVKVDLPLHIVVLSEDVGEEIWSVCHDLLQTDSALGLVDGPTHQLPRSHDAINGGEALVQQHLPQGLSQSIRPIDGRPSALVTRQVTIHLARESGGRGAVAALESLLVTVCHRMPRQERN
ncbi:hypothetical protein PENTCL1PPCAC_13908, partial [Pristionchus entomophagus]